MSEVKRGFMDFVGEEIVDVDTTAINVVYFRTKSGKIISVDAEQSHCGIPVIAVSVCSDKQWEPEVGKYYFFSNKKECVGTLSGRIDRFAHMINNKISPYASEFDYWAYCWPIPKDMIGE